MPALQLDQPPRELALRQLRRYEVIMMAIQPCTTASYTTRGWDPVTASLAACYWQTGERRLLDQLLRML